MFIVGDFETDFEVKLSNDLRCLVSSTGNATAAGNTEIRLYKPVVWGIEYRVNKEFIPQNIPSSTYQYECQKLFTAYKSAR
jgi:hypothetical protein